MTPTDKLKRVAKLCDDLQDEDNEAIIEGRIAGLAKELKVSAMSCAMVYWLLKEKGAYLTMFGGNVRIKARAR